jgi:carbon storage regulator
MLVLTRRVNETIQIGDNVCIKIIRGGRNSVQIGIEAPRSVEITRGELQPPSQPATSRVAATLCEVPCLGTVS